MRRLALCLALLLAACVHKAPPSAVSEGNKVCGPEPNGQTICYHMDEPIPQECGAIPCANPPEKAMPFTDIFRAACKGSFPGCCSSHGGIAEPRRDDGSGHVQCVDGEDYPKADSCRCER
jgi:hypothetical protein